jgi:phosphoribosyl 1,2-cyclic phosphodiesterase
MPFFPAGDRDDAQVSVLLPAQADGRSAEEVLARGMSPPQFPISPTELRGQWSFGDLSPGRLEIEGFTVEAREIPHKGGRTFGYRVSDGRSAMAYAPDHCPTVFGPGPDGWGEYHEDALALAAGVDVLVHDAHLLAGELAAEAAWGHAAADYAVALGERAEARRVVLFHHKADRTDDELDELGRGFESAAVQVTVGAEGMVLEL